MSPSFLLAAQMTEKTGTLGNGLTEVALAREGAGASHQPAIAQSAENKDGKPTPGGKVYTRH
jgi:hypothetical protein